jgi:hypothetical protein
MKLAKVSVEYTCGLTLVDKMSFDVARRAESIPPRLGRLMGVMKDNDCSPTLTMEYEGYFGTSNRGARWQLLRDVDVSEWPAGAAVVNSIAFPTKEQRQQNGRLLHTFSAAYVIGAFGYVNAVTRWDAMTVFNAVSLVVLGVIFWYVGFLHMKESNVAAKIVTLVFGASVVAFFMWTNHNGQKRDCEREWCK